MATCHLRKNSNMSISKDTEFRFVIVHKYQLYIGTYIQCMCTQVLGSVHRIPFPYFRFRNEKTRNTTKSIFFIGVGPVGCSNNILTNLFIHTKKKLYVITQNKVHHYKKKISFWKIKKAPHSIREIQNSQNHAIRR